MAHFTDLENYLTIILIPFNALVLSILSFNFFNIPNLLDFKPFNCFTCTTLWLTIILILIYSTNILNFEVLQIQTTIEAGFLLGYEIDKKQYK